MTKILAILLLVGTLLLAGCGSDSSKGVTAKDVQQKTAEAVETTKNYTLQQKEEYQKQVQTKIDSLSQQIDELKAKAGRATDQSKQGITEQIAALEKEKQAAQNKLTELTSAGAEAWGALKSGMDAAMGSLEKSYKEAVSKFEK